MFFARKNEQQSYFSEYIETKTKLFYSKVVYALNGEHEHYFSKVDVMNSNADTRCKVCGILLSEYRIQESFEKMNAPVVLNETKIAGK